MSLYSRFARAARRTPTLFLLLLLLTLSTLLAGVPFSTSSAPAPFVAAQRTKRDRNCESCSPPGNQQIYIPLIDLPESAAGELVFNSRSPNAMNVTPVFYKRNGSVVVAEPVQIDAGEIRYANIRDLLPERYRHERELGGFALTYYGTNREMWSQFRFLGVNGGGSVDEFFTVKEEARAAAYEGAWWAPEKSEVIVALGNISDSATSATVSFRDGETKTVTLPPHASEIVRQRYRDQGPESVRIEVTGPAGSIVPTGLITTRNGSFNSVIRFYDPGAAKQPNLYANGLRLAGVTPHLVLKNTTQAPVAVLPKLIPATGKAGEITLSQVALGANETREVDLRELFSNANNRNDLGVVSVEVTNWNAPGSVIGSVYAVNDRNGIAYDVPLRDSGPIRSMTGAYPWRIDGDYKSIAYVTNISDEPVQYIVELAYKGGKFTLGPRKLQPRETAAYDPESIRDLQTKDAGGHALPADVSQGQFRWAIRGSTNGQTVLIGRTEMVSRSEKVSSSYSCPMDCGPTYDAWLTDFPGNLVIGQSGLAAAVETATWNYGYTMGPYSASASWSASPVYVSFDQANATDTSVTGMTEGTSSLSGLVGTYDRYDWDGLNCVFMGTYQNFVGDLLDILTAPHAFAALSVTETDLGCPSGTFGFGAKVKYVVTGLSALPVRQAGMTPREIFFINGVPNSFLFSQFATPPDTDSNGTFTDIPIGTCFPGSPFSSLNPCLSVKQTFDIVVPNDPNSPYSIITETLRKDCRRGIRVEVQNGPVSETFTLGEVP